MAVSGEAQHEAGYSLPEVAQRMDTSAGINALCGHLDVVAGRAEEMLDGLRLKCERARALRCALSGVAKDAQGAVEWYLRERIGSEEVELIQRMLTHLAAERMEEGIVFSVLIDEGHARVFGRCLRSRESILPSNFGWGLGRLIVWLACWIEGLRPFKALNIRCMRRRVKVVGFCACPDGRGNRYVKREFVCEKTTGRQDVCIA